MIYRSNLQCPDLLPQFKHVKVEPQPNSFGHDVITHWTDKGDDFPEMWKKCGSLTHDEAAILYNVVKQLPGTWLDIGANVGWTAAHLRAAGAWVVALEPMLTLPEWKFRFRENTQNAPWLLALVSLTSRAYFQDLVSTSFIRFTGVMIDGDHSWGEPLYDAQQAAAHLNETGVIVFHDFIGGPVQEAALWLMDNGFKCRVYFTPFMLAVCWRGDFVPPDHVPDPNLPDMRTRCENTAFPFERCE